MEQPRGFSNENVVDCPHCRFTNNAFVLTTRLNGLCGRCNTAIPPVIIPERFRRLLQGPASRPVLDSCGTV